MDTQLLNETKLFEKIEIQWFSTKAMKTQLREFRPFYREIVKKILSNTSSIESFIRSCMSGKRSSRKRISHKTQKRRD